ncbi:MAG: pilus assembly protein TadG-related protein [Nocardioides sp.]|nr:pilus assembly protein TadG-related protein [Nocardioides sp.]
MRTAIRRGRLGRRGDDAGQMVAPLVIFLGFTVLAFIVVALVPVGAATNERSRSQTAADAAALAGAEEARTIFSSTSTVPGPLLLFLPGEANLLPPFTGATGLASANSYAALNGSSVENYNLGVGSGRVYAKVQSNTAAYEEHGRAVAEATAEMDISFECTWSGVLPGAYFPSGAPTFTVTLQCGQWSATYTVLNEPGYATISYDTTPQGIYDDLEPRLVD